MRPPSNTVPPTQPTDRPITDGTVGGVFFVGAGPGHPDLLTVRATEYLRQADVVVYDALVPQGLLDAIGSRAKSIPAPRNGTHGDDPGLATGRLLAELAADGRTVVRLKGGDPSVFARLAEELQPVREAGIRWEIIPGVTAALAAAAAAGVPLTSRTAASSLTILTGHEADEKSAALDFASLAGLPGTLAIYMGVERVGRWSQLLIEAGKPAATPVTVISRCSWPDQQIASTTLGACADAFEDRRWPAPAVVIVGEVAQNAPEEPTARRPLVGRRVLLTRPAGQADELDSLVRQRGGEPLHVPVIQIGNPDSWEPLDAAIAAADTFDWIVFASVHGVRSFFTRLRAGGRDARHFGTARLAAIGPATAREVAAQGCACDLVPDEHRSEGVVLALGQTVRDGRFLLVRANRGRDLMRRELESLGHSVTEVAAYASTAVPTITPDLLAAIDRGGIDWITLTSSYIAETAVRLFGTRLQRWKVASISPVTTAALKSIGLTPNAEARHPTAAGLVEAMAEWESLQGGFMGAAQPAKPEQPPSPADSPS